MDHTREHRTPPLARVMGVVRQQQLSKISHICELNLDETIAKRHKSPKHRGDVSTNYVEASHASINSQCWRYYDGGQSLENSKHMLQSPHMIH